MMSLIWFRTDPIPTRNLRPSSSKAHLSVVTEIPSFMVASIIGAGCAPPRARALRVTPERSDGPTVSVVPGELAVPLAASTPSAPPASNKHNSTEPASDSVVSSSDPASASPRRPSASWSISGERYFAASWGAGSGAKNNSNELKHDHLKRERG